MGAVALTKFIHVAAVIVTGSFFLIRGIWMLRASPLLSHPVVRIAPHVNDTVLFVSAISLAWLLGIAPWQAPWLAAKIAGLLLYIVLGHFALRRGKTRSGRAAYFAAALLTLGYILAVARCRDPLACLGG